MNNVGSSSKTALANLLANLIEDIEMKIERLSFIFSKPHPSRVSNHSPHET